MQRKARDITALQMHTAMELHELFSFALCNDVAQPIPSQKIVQRKLRSLDTGSVTAWRGTS